MIMDIILHILELSVFIDFELTTSQLILHFSWVNHWGQPNQWFWLDSVLVFVGFRLSLGWLYSFCAR